MVCGGQCGAGWAVWCVVGSVVCGGRCSVWWAVWCVVGSVVSGGQWACITSRPRRRFLCKLSAIGTMSAAAFMQNSFLL